MKTNPWTQCRNSNPATAGRNLKPNPSPDRRTPSRWAGPGLGCALLLAATPALSAEVLSTTAYHQLTSFPEPGLASLNHSLAISADGSKIAFARPYYGGPSRSNLIYTVNFDGSGLTLVDRYAVPDCYPRVDISADGSKVLSWDGYGQVRVVNADGSNPHHVIQVNGGYPDFRLSPDGTKVYFSNDRNFGTTPDTGTREPGLYVINADSTDFHEVAGLTSFALFFGLAPGDLAPAGYLYNWNGGNPFGLSGDGSKLACYVWTPAIGYRLLALSANGSGMHELPLAPTPVQSILRVGLSGDGSKVSYYLDYSPCCSSGEELGVINWDGSGRRVLCSNYSTNQSSGGYGAGEIAMNWNGSKVLFGQTSRLYNTDGSGMEQVFGPAGYYTEVMRWGFCRGVMNSNATRFAYLSPVGNGPLQLATMQLNPPSLGLAPPITEASANPPYVRNSDQASTFVSARAPTNGLLSNFVSAFAFLNGLPDQSVEQPYLGDDSAGGDLQAGDGVYSRWMNPANLAAIGPRTLRFKTEWRASDSNYHATVVEIAPFFVLSQVPTNPPPTVITISPAGAPPGTTVTITGSGFDPNAAHNVVLFGNVPAQVISVNPQGTQLVVVIPAGLPTGTVAVTVSSQGQTSATSGYSVPDPDAATVEIKTLAGLEICGTIGLTYRVEYVNDLQNTNDWTTLTNLVLPASPCFWVDLTSANQPKRFYRCVRVP